METKEPNIYINELRSNVTNNDTVKTDNVYISWLCEEENAPYCEFRYQLNFGTWSAWETNLRSFNAYLDDSEYVFIVQARFINLRTQSEKTVHFYVKALQSPAVYVFPRQQSFLSDTAKLIIKTKEIPISYGMELTFSSNLSIEVSQLYGVNDPNISFGFTKNKAFLMVLPGGEPLNGNCDLMGLSISGISMDSLTFTIDSCFVWDSAKVNIELEMIRGGFLVKENDSVF